MNKNTGRRTVTTTNFVNGANAASVWDRFQTDAADELIGSYITSHETFATDAGYVSEYGVPEIWEYSLPGLRVVVFAVDGTVDSVITVEDVVVMKLHKAVRKEQPVTVTYTKADGEETVRTIEPRSLKLTKSGDVIVKALDRKSGEHRTFRADRITAYTVHRTRFTVRTEAPAPTKTELVSAFQATANGSSCDGSGHRGSCNILEHWDWKDGRWIHPQTWSTFTRPVSLHAAFAN